jgi:hypothetical protein
MKALRMIPIAILLVSAVALTGCSRDELAHEGRGTGRNGEVVSRGQGG